MTRLELAENMFLSNGNKAAIQASYQIVVDQFVSGMKEAYHVDVSEQFEKDVSSIVDGLYTAILTAAAEHFEIDELEAFYALYSSPVGQRIKAKEQQLPALMEALNERFRGLVIDRLQKEEQAVLSTLAQTKIETLPVKKLIIP